MNPNRMTTGARVLIVDDDAPARRLLQVRLRAMGCEVALAGDGEEAMARRRWRRSRSMSRR